MPTATLEKMCTRRLVRAIDGLTDVGDLPYRVIANVLSSIENPSQLEEIEKKSPQIVGETRGIWLRFIKRDIPNWEKRMHEPWNPDNWCSETYFELKRQHDKEVEASEAQLLAAISQKREEKKSRQLEFVETVNDPRPKKRKPQRVTPRSGNSMDRIRRGMGTVKRKDPMATQSHLLAGQGSRPTHVPPSMLDDYRRRLALQKSQIPPAQPTGTYPSRKTPANQSLHMERSNQLSSAAVPEQRPRQPGPSFLQAAAAANRKRKVPGNIFGPNKRRA